MTDAALALHRQPGLAAKLREGRTLPLLAVSAAIIAVWYLGAIWLNAGLVEQRL